MDRHLFALGRTCLGGLARLAYPGACWVCEAPTEADPLVCSACAIRLSHDPHPSCPRCSSSIGPYAVVAHGCPACRDESFAFDGALRMAPYTGLLREMILRMKQPPGEELTEVIGALWASRCAPRLRSLQPDLVVPIPLHWTRRLWRGFNQSEVLAQCLSRELRVPCRPGLLRRVRRTPFQSRQTTASARRANVRGAFTARTGEVVRDQTVVLVDDVLTTGATASEAARALRVGQPRRVIAVVLAHGS